MAETPRTPDRSGRPWYLVLALLVCSGLGACGSTSGWETINIYRGAQTDDGTHDVSREEDRKAIGVAFDRVLASMDAERPRAFPLAVGELVLGLAMFMLSAAAMTGRGGARRALVQVVAAQAVLIIITFVLTQKIQIARIDWGVAHETAKLLEKGTSQGEADQTLAATRVFYRGASIAALVVRSAIAALLMVALTRPRARAYFDAQNERPNES